MRLLSTLLVLLALTPGVMAAGVFHPSAALGVEGPLDTPTTVTASPERDPGLVDVEAGGAHAAFSTSRTVHKLTDETRGPEAVDATRALDLRSPRVSLSYELPRAYGPIVSNARVERHDRTFADSPFPARDAVRAPSPLSMLGDTPGGTLLTTPHGSSNPGMSIEPREPSHAEPEMRPETFEGTAADRPQGAWRAVAAGAVILLVLAPLALYHRLRGQGVLESGRRQRVLRLITETPGLGITEMARLIEVDPTTALYHVRRLLKEGLVIAEGKPRAARYFVAGAHTPDERARLLAERAAAPVLEAIRHEPGLPKSALAARLDIARPTLAWHLAGLERAGLVRSERCGREVRVFPASSA